MWILIKHVNIVSGVKKVCHPKTCRWANTESFSCGDGQNRRTEQNGTPRYYSAGVSQFTSGAKKAHFLWLGVVQNTRIITGSALAPFSMRVYFRASRVPCTVGSVHVRQLLARDPGTWSTHTHTHTPTPAKHLCCCWVSALTKQWADANLLKLTTHTHTHTQSTCCHFILPYMCSAAGGLCRLPVREAEEVSTFSFKVSRTQQLPVIKGKDHTDNRSQLTAFIHYHLYYLPAGVIKRYFILFRFRIVPDC